MAEFQLFLIDRYDQIIDTFTEQDLTEALEHPILNGDHTFTFAVHARETKAEGITEGRFVAFLDEEDDFQLFEIVSVRDKYGETLEKRAECIHACYELADEEIIKDQKPRNAAVSPVLDNVLEGTRWERGIVGDLGQQSLNFYREHPMSCIQKIIDEWGGEVKYRITIDNSQITGRYVDMLSRRGENRGKRIEYGKDLEEITRTGDINNMYTALYGFGRGEEIEGEEGEDSSFSRRITFTDVEWKTSDGDPVDKPAGQWWVGDPEALESSNRIKNGELRHRFGEFEDQDEEEPEALLQKTWDSLQQQKNAAFSYEAKIIDLYRLLGLEHEKMALGDTIAILNDDIQPAIEVSVRVMKLELDKLDETNDRVVLGDFLPLFTDEDPVISKIKSDYQESGRSINDPIISDRNYPDIQPPTPENVQAEGLFQTILLKWDYNSSSTIKGWEIYASQVLETVKNPENRTAVTRVNTHSFMADTNETYYFAIRAINHHGRASDWSPVVEASTEQVRTPEILFGEDTAEFLETLSVKAEMLSEEAKNMVQQTAATYTDEQITSARTALEEDIAAKIEQGDIDEAVSGLVREVDYDEDYDGLISRFQSNETSIDQNAEDITLEAERITQNEDDISSTNAELSVQTDRITSTVERVDTAEDELSEAQSRIDQQADELDLRVKQDDIIARINVSPETILLDAERIRISGLTEIEAGAIGQAAIADAAIQRFHLDTGIIEDVHIEDETVTDSKIKNLSADKVLVGTLIGHTLEAGYIRGTEIQGSGIFSIDTNDSFIRTQIRDSRILNFGYYAGNDYDFGRLQIGDGRLILEKIANNSIDASSTDSLSLHPDSIFKTQRQSDGSLQGRGQIFFASNVSVIEMNAANVKFEDKVEINGDIKNNSDANEIGNLTVQTLGVDNRIRTSSIVDDNRIGLLPERDNHSNPLYFEMRDNYASMNLIYKSIRMKMDNDNNRFLFQYNNSSSYVEVVASDFNTSSDETGKTDIRAYNGDALAAIQATTPYHYRRIGRDRIDLGLIAQEAPDELIRGNEGDLSINQYAMTTMSWRAIQQLADENKILKDRIKILEEAIA